jgi:hypothetical protein
MRLHRIDIHSGQTGISQRRIDHRLLRSPVRCRQPVGRAVGVHRATAHHRQHMVPMTLGIRQPLQQQHPDTLTQTRAISGFGKRLATAVSGQATLPAELRDNSPHRPKTHPHAPDSAPRRTTEPYPNHDRQETGRSRHRRRRPDPTAVQASAPRQGTDNPSPPRRSAHGFAPALHAAAREPHAVRWWPVADSSDTAVRRPRFSCQHGSQADQDRCLWLSAPMTCG